MKKIIITLAIVLCSCMSAFSQATSLTIDCQNPGWLSSKIGYGDQQSIVDLKVTGFINDTDMEFIGTLMKQHSLKRLDLELVDIVPSNYLNQDVFKFEWNDNCHLEKLVLPLSIKKIVQDSKGCFSNIYIDTLVMGGHAMPEIKNSVYSKTRYGSSFNKMVKHLIIREGVESISDSCFLYNYRKEYYTGNIYDYVFPQTLKDVILPSSIKKIGALAFCGNEFTNLILPDSVEEIGMDAFIGTSMRPDTLWRPDTLFLPASIKRFNISAFNTPSKVYYFPANVIYIDNMGRSIDNINSKEDLITRDMSIEFHFKCSNPPTFKCENNAALTNSTVFVPKGASEEYKKTIPWDKATIIEEIMVEGVSLDKNKLLYVGDLVTLSIQFLPTDATNKNVNWESSNPAVATISKDGTITAVSYGTTNITVTSIDGGFKATCVVNVYEHTTGVQMTEKMSIAVADEYQLEVQTLPLSTSDGRINYSSNNTNIAVVNESGLITAKAKGECIITATSVDGGYKATCTVTVTQPVEALTMEKHSTTLKVGETETLHAQISPATADNKAITWTSSNDSIAIVDANGTVKALKAGEAWIKAVSVDNPEAKDSCKVTVTQPVTGIVLNYSKYEMHTIGESFNLEATISPSDASNKNVKWSSTNESVCVVSRGTVIAVGEGTCVIIANTEDGGFIATCTVVVTCNFQLTYKVDGEVYKTSTVAYGTAITPETEPTKEGYTFSGWSEIPTTMPANDVVVTGTFSVNTYQVTFMYGDEVLKTDSVEYGAVIPLPESLESDRYTLVEWLDVPETMPAHDLIIYADYTDGIEGMRNERMVYAIYDLSGRRIAKMQRGVNIIRYSDGTSKRVMVK